MVLWRINDEIYGTDYKIYCILNDREKDICDGLYRITNVISSSSQLTP